jgi:hypothetical protein
LACGHACVFSGLLGLFHSRWLLPGRSIFRRLSVSSSSLLLPSAISTCVGVGVDVVACGRSAFSLRVFLLPSLLSSL